MILNEISSKYFNFPLQGNFLPNSNVIPIAIFYLQKTNRHYSFARKMTNYIFHAIWEKNNYKETEKKENNGVNSIYQISPKKKYNLSDMLYI